MSAGFRWNVQGRDECRIEICRIGTSAGLSCRVGMRNTGLRWNLQGRDKCKLEVKVQGRDQFWVKGKLQDRDQCWIEVKLAWLGSVQGWSEICRAGTRLTAGLRCPVEEKLNMHINVDEVKWTEMNEGVSWKELDRLEGWVVVELVCWVEQGSAMEIRRKFPLELVMKWLVKNLKGHLLVFLSDESCFWS